MDNARESRKQTLTRQEREEAHNIASETLSVGKRLNGESYVAGVDDFMDRICKQTLVELDLEEVAKELLLGHTDSRSVKVATAMAKAICQRFGRRVVTVDEIVEIIENRSTHILHYHDKEGRTTNEQVIHKARFQEIAKAIFDFVNGGKG